MAGRDGSLFMRPLAYGWTAYLFGTNALFLLTRGGFHSPDSWAEIYSLVLATYASAPEVKRWVVKQNLPDEPDDWHERLRKGGPLVVAWNLLLAAAGALRMYDPSWPMPPELKAITMQIMAVFFGTYALRQIRRRSVSGSGARAGVDESDAVESGRVIDVLRQAGPLTPTALSERTGIPRRTLARLLARLTTEKKLIREARYASDPAATYHLPS
jgi:hypothetical protein